jgi:hypothetical protein
MLEFKPRQNWNLMSSIQAKGELSLCWRTQLRVSFQKKSVFQSVIEYQAHCLHINWLQAETGAWNHKLSFSKPVRGIFWQHKRSTESTGPCKMITIWIYADYINTNIDVNVLGSFTLHKVERLTSNHKGKCVHAWTFSNSDMLHK